jgi:hypothetical protein
MAILTKEQLFNKVSSAIELCGWQIQNPSDTGQQPVRFEILKNNEVQILRLYIWNLTSGGKGRSENEFRIQVKVDRFEEESNSTTLILGYSDEKDIFAGFDISKHIGKPGWSASMQIKEVTLNDAKEKKVAAYVKENGEIAIAFTPDFIINYVNDFSDLHLTGNLNKYFIGTNADEVVIDDETESEVLPFRYSITSYGADYPVDAIVKRIDSDVIFLPPFQRKYVWNIKEASRFIESLILGLPVPGVFLSKEEETQKLLIVDGQQRLFSLYSFYKNNFRGKPFKLTGVQDDLKDKSYADLNSSDRMRLDDSIIHATIVKQDEPDDNESSIYLIFERLNTGGRLLMPQEIRACVYYGDFNEYLNKVTLEKDWRDVFGKMNDRLKEQEILLRYFALYYDINSYEKPLKGFLNLFMGSNRQMERFNSSELDHLILPSIAFINRVLGKKAFRLGGGINAALFDAVMIGLTKRLEQNNIVNEADFLEAYNSLIEDKDFTILTKDGTSDENTVNKRISLATQKFSLLK